MKKGDLYLFDNSYYVITKCDKDNHSLIWLRIKNTRDYPNYIMDQDDEFIGSIYHNKWLSWYFQDIVKEIKQ